MKFILPLLHLTTAVLGYSSYNYDDSEIFIPDEIVAPSNHYEVVLNSIYDVLKEQVNLVLKETLNNAGFSYVNENHGDISLSFKNNLKIELNDTSKISYCFKSSNCTDYNQITISEVEQGEGFKINHNGNFGNLGQSNINFDSFEAVSQFYENDSVVIYESNNTFTDINGNSETLKGFIKFLPDASETKLNSIEIGITECTDAFQNLNACPFKSIKLSLEIDTEEKVEEHDTNGDDSNDIDNESGSGNWTDDYSSSIITARYNFAKITIEIDDNEIPYSPIVIGKRETYSEFNNPISIRLQIPNFITLNLAGNSYKDQNNNKIAKVYLWATEKVSDVIFFPFDKEFPLHIITLEGSGKMIEAVGNFFTKGKIWYEIFDIIFRSMTYDPMGSLYKSMIIALNMDELYNKMKENNSFDFSDIIKASQFDSGLLYILGHENYIWHDEKKFFSTKGTEGHLNQILCGMAKDFNDNVLKDLYHVGESAKSFRKHVTDGLSDKWYNENFSG